MPSVRLRFLYLALPVLTVAAMFMLVYPAESLYAAERGVSIWWDILFPALFPFLVLSEMMLGFGLVHFFGTLLDPIMRPLFRIPGIGGFVVAMGFASGYPVAARLTAQLWEEQLVTREEGERLVAFTTTSDPIFLIGAVAVGFFGDVRLAVVLAAAHYGAALLLGLAMRFHGVGAPPTPTKPISKRESLLRRSFTAMHRARLADGRPFGILLQQAIRTSIRLVFVIGGLVVFFSVLLELLRLTHAMDLFHLAIGSLLQAVGLPTPLSEAIVNGIFEVTLGAKAAGQAGGGLPLETKAAVCALVLSWAGLSVHAQVVSLLHKTNLRYGPFALARLLHGLLAAALTVALWGPLQGGRATETAAMQLAWAPRGAAAIGTLVWHWSLPASVVLAVALLLVLAAAGLIHRILRFMHVWFRNIG